MVLFGFFVNKVESIFFFFVVCLKVFCKVWGEVVLFCGGMIFR